MVCGTIYVIVEIDYKYRIHGIIYHSNYTENIKTQPNVETMSQTVANIQTAIGHRRVYIIYFTL